MLAVFIEDLTLSKVSPNSFYYEGSGKAGAEIAKRKPYGFDPPLLNAQHHVRVMILRRVSHNKRLLPLVLYIFIVNITTVFVHFLQNCNFSLWVGFLLGGHRQPDPRAARVCGPYNVVRGIRTMRDQ